MLGAEVNLWAQSTIIWDFWGDSLSITVSLGLVHYPVGMLIKLKLK